ncbi:MAG: plasmid pRiA4b ORF-3 family protein [Nitrososphaerales archaeon]
MAQPAKSAAAQIYQIKVTLRGVRPPIWRRIQVPDNFTLAKLHRIIQVVMGWDNYHLHVFSWEGLEYGDPDRDLGIRSDARVRLSQLHLLEKSRFRYEYDFGDSWEHDLLVEKILPPERGVTYPRCLTGKRACPPEDVGGIWGYANFLEAMQDSAHPAHEEYLEWIGGEFDSEAFDLEAVNLALSILQ